MGLSRSKSIRAFRLVDLPIALEEGFQVGHLNILRKTVKQDREAEKAGAGHQADPAGVNGDLGGESHRVAPLCTSVIEQGIELSKNIEQEKYKGCIFDL